MKDEDGGGARTDLENLRLSFLFIFIIYIGQGIYPVYKRRKKKDICSVISYISVHMYQAWVVMFQKCPEKKKTPSLRPTQAPWPFA